jgi:hypothetical protein
VQSLSFAGPDRHMDERRMLVDHQWSQSPLHTSRSLHPPHPLRSKRNAKPSRYGPNPWWGLPPGVGHGPPHHRDYRERKQSTRMGHNVPLWGRVAQRSIGLRLGVRVQPVPGRAFTRSAGVRPGDCRSHCPDVTLRKAERRLQDYELNQVAEVRRRSEEASALTPPGSSTTLAPMHSGPHASEAVRWCQLRFGGSGAISIARA